MVKKKTKGVIEKPDQPAMITPVNVTDNLKINLYTFG